MQDFPDINASLSIHLTLQQALAFRLLERHGLRYLVDFGLDNAIQKAQEISRDQPKNRATLLASRSS